LHSEEIGICPRRSLEEDTNVKIVHFIVSNGHIRRGEIGFLSVRNKNSDVLLRNSGESTFNSLEETICINIPSSSYNDILSDVVSLEVILHVLFSDVADVFSDTVRRLTNIVVSVRSEVNILKDHGLLIILCANDIVVDSFFLRINLCFVDDRVLEDITEEIDSLRDVSRKSAESVGSSFSADSHFEISTEQNKFLLDLLSVSLLSSSENESLDKLSDT
jgi:hypothetical protein